MKISVIIPVYNAEKYIDRCLQSILRQGIEDMEIICVDDGSIDSTLDILHYYAAHYTQVIVITQSHKYAGVARNTGLKIAKGEYVHFLDADDYLLENVYASLIEEADKKKIDCLKFKNNCFSACSGEQKENEFAEYTMKDVPEEYYIGREVVISNDIKMLVRDVSHTPWSGIFRREFLIDNGIKFNDLICVNDRSFFVETLVKAKKIALSNLIVVNHQIDNAGSLVGIRTKNFLCHYENFRIVEKILKEVSSEIRKVILNDEIRDIFAWYNSMPEEERDKEKNRFNSFIDELNWEIVERDELIAAEIEKTRKNELICPDVSGEIYYLYSKIRIQGKYIVDVLEAFNFERVYIYGYGEIGQMMLADLSQSHAKNVKGIFDKKAEDNDTVIDEYSSLSVKAPQKIPDDDVPIIITLSKNYKEVIRSLVGIGIEPQRIILLQQLLKSYFEVNVS